jgi:hypothetical protein
VLATPSEVYYYGQRNMDEVKTLLTPHIRPATQVAQSRPFEELPLDKLYCIFL